MHAKLEIVAQIYISTSGVQWGTLGYKYTFAKVGKWGTVGYIGVQIYICKSGVHEGNEGNEGIEGNEGYEKMMEMRKMREMRK